MGISIVESEWLNSYQLPSLVASKKNLIQRESKMQNSNDIITYTEDTGEK